MRARPQSAGARRRGGDGQRVAAGGAHRRERHRERPDTAAARRGPQHRGGRGPRARMDRGGRREPAVRGRVVRRRHVRDRRDVRAPSPGRRGRTRARVPSRRQDRAAELDPRRHARRAVRHDEAVRPAAAARRAAAAAVGQRAARAGALRRSGRLPHARARRARDHRLRAGPRVRRALHVVLRADDRGARQRGAQRARDRVRRGAGAVLRATGTAEPPSRRASRRSTCSRSAPGTDAGPDGSRARAGGSRSLALDAADRADSVEHSSSRGRPRDSRPFSLPSPPQVRRVGSRCGGRWHPSTGSRHQPAPPVP